MKIPIEDVEQILHKKQLPPEQISSIISDLKKVIEEIKNEKEEEKLPKQKNEFGIILTGLDKELEDKITGWIYQIKSETDHGTVLEKIRTAAINQNERKTKRKKDLIATFGEAFSCLKRAFIKEQGVNIKTKQSCRILITENKF